MKRPATIFLLIMLLSCHSYDKSAVIFFGDSITEMGVEPGGYIDRLQEALTRSPKAENTVLIGKGIGGNKIYDLYLRMDKDVISLKPDVVVIFEGVNDVWHKAMMGTGTDLDKYEKFYTAVIQKLQVAGIRLILITPACIGEKKNNENPQDPELNQYCEVIRHLSATYRCDLIDFRKMVQDYEQAHNSENRESGLLTTDGVHLNESGNQMLADVLAKALEF